MAEIRSTDSDADGIKELRRQLMELRAENDRLRGLLGVGTRDEAVSPWEPTLFVEDEGGADGAAVTAVDRHSPREAKIAVFRSLFVGREDVHARRWENPRSAKAGWSPAVRGGWANSKKTSREYLPFSDEVVGSHLSGEVHAGLYPLLRGDACRLLVCDFDGVGWLLDALAYLDAARAVGIPVALERSRSGDGAHVWAFFSGPVAASLARQVGAHLLREAMTIRSELDLASYDRLFPAQDFMPKGSFGNLIALPLNGECRKRGTTVFLDPSKLEPFEDQWAFLSSLARVSPKALADIARSIPPIGAGPEDATYRRPSTSGSPKPPEQIVASAGAMLSIERIGIPPALLSSLKHAASLHNPAYYEKERLRFSTWNTPRFVRCYGETLDRLLIPRGITAQAAKIISEAGSCLEVADACPDPEPADFVFTAELTGEQRSAFDALAQQDLGVLIAPPGTGKTVIACALIAHHELPTLVIVDRQPLVEQWRDRLVEHLGLEQKQIGQLGGGRRKARGLVDIATAQSLARREDLAELGLRYGLVVVDECHHVPAVTFERCVRQLPVRRWLGLTATPYRRDGLQGLITMYCGPIRHRIGARVDATSLARLELVVHGTKHSVPEPEGLGIQEVFRGIVEDDERTEQICADVLVAVGEGRNCLVLAQWTGHVEAIAEGLRKIGLDPYVLHGGMPKKQRTEVVGKLTQGIPGGGLLLVATGGLLGEGFDCPPLDTLFLAFPLAFKGRLVQYVGRVLRPLPEKTSIEVHDYVDFEVPVLARMHGKRLPGYASLGFDTKHRSGRSA